MKKPYRQWYGRAADNHEEPAAVMLVDGRRNDDIFIHQLLIFIFTQCGKGNKLIPLCLQLWQYLYNGVFGEVVDIMQRITEPSCTLLMIFWVMISAFLLLQSSVSRSHSAKSRVDTARTLLFKAP